VPELQHSQPTPAYCSKRKSWILLVLIGIAREALGPGLPS
jgi:hypothetical protein